MTMSRAPRLSVTSIEAFEQPFVLGVAQRPEKLEPPLYHRDPNVLLLALCAVGFVRLGSAQLHLDTIQRPALPVSIHPECHDHAAAQRAKQQLVGCRTTVGTAERGRLIRHQTM